MISKVFSHTNAMEGTGKTSVGRGGHASFFIIGQRIEQKQVPRRGQARLCRFCICGLVEMTNFIPDGELFTVYPSIKDHRDRAFVLPRLKEYYEDGEKCPSLPFNS
mmetsp:Transcript_42269/g.77233  ORF Transcript_42269/g.77233 Transcript_42269/m.77233 type:complete len:106 (-) Transcript_42269:938-1255(-)